MKVRFAQNKNLVIGLHILGWAFILLIPQYLNRVYGGGDHHFMNQFYANAMIYGLVFYLNYLWLVPKYFFADTKFSYIAGVTVLIVLSCIGLFLINEKLFFDENRARLMDRIMRELNNGDDPPRAPVREFRIFGVFITSVLICGFSLGLGVLGRLFRNEQERKELEKAKLNSELAFLKNQISPHFFFNTLNNIYALIGFDAEEARNAVLKLSKLMRYLLYDSDRAQTKLSDEVDFLTLYIALMKLRVNEKVTLDVKLPQDTPDILIPPLLFVPFVENAFKYGVSYREPSFIEIRLLVGKDSLMFLTRNSIAPESFVDNKSRHSGIGLENVRKRLNLLYPGAHTLEVGQKDGEFVATLILKRKDERFD